jgi:aldehyde dehydrogenase (NAD+)
MDRQTAQQIFKKQKDYFFQGHTQTYEFRLQQLERLESLIRDNSDRICQALYQDLRKSATEALISEVAVTLDELHLAKKNLKSWMTPTACKTPLTLLPARSRIHYDPLGSVLIIGPWNYPFQLVISPLVGAIAAGNCAVVKPSELTPKTAQLVEDLISKHFPLEFIRVQQGGIPETTALLGVPFDHIFFTGSTPVGRIVMQAAADNLTPVTLELGGKSPAIVCQDADLALAARRLVWGKFYNAGQTCVAPDYLYVHKDVADSLHSQLVVQIKEQFGENPQHSPDLTRIVNQKNVERLQKMLDPQKISHGGRTDLADLYIEPTLMRSVTWDDLVMKEEIFGPIFPILTFENLDMVFTNLQNQPKPLSAYLFTEDNDNQQRFLNELSFGGGCINDVIVHLGNSNLPFGGVGHSGTGRYHGHHSFLTFSHQKSVMVRYKWFDLSARYAPYSEKNLKLLKRLFGLT